MWTLSATWVSVSPLAFPLDEVFFRATNTAGPDAGLGVSTATTTALTRAQEMIRRESL